MNTNISGFLTIFNHILNYSVAFNPFFCTFPFVFFLCISVTIVLCFPFISPFLLIFMWLFLVFRTLPSALCQVVTVRVCRSPHVVCQAVHTLPGNQSIIKWRVTIIFLSLFFVTALIVTKKYFFIFSLSAILCSHLATDLSVVHSFLYGLQVTALICLLIWL